MLPALLGRPSRWVLALPLLLSLPLAGCTKPEPPKIKPIDAKVKSASLTGLEIDLKLEATNPNSIPLSARSVKAHVWVNGDIDVGEIVIPTKTSIPAKETVTLEVPVSVPWTNLTSIAMAAATKESMPFKVSGTAEVGVEAVSFDVPFETTGTITRQQLGDMATKSFPGLQIPSGFKLPL